MRTQILVKKKRPHIIAYLDKVCEGRVNEV